MWRREGNGSSLDGWGMRQSGEGLGKEGRKKQQWETDLFLHSQLDLLLSKGSLSFQSEVPAAVIFPERPTCI